jgi:hypothetical protein
MLVVDGAPAANAVASVPPTVGVLRVTAVASTFLMVIVCDRVSPGAADPKLMLDGEAVSTMFCGALGVMSAKSVALSFVSCSVTAAPPGLRS